MVRQLTKGVNEYSRNVNYSRKRRYLHLKKGVKPDVVKLEKHKAPKVGKRLNAKWYGVDRHKVLPHKRPGHFKLRKSLTPGTVLILIAGRFKGRRVIMLKVLESGLLLVTGPYAINGVPFRRVNPAYVIATSTRITLPSIPALNDIKDDYFRPKKEKKPKKTKDGGGFFEKKAQKKGLSSERKKLQRKIDLEVRKAADKDKFLIPYLRIRFTLRKFDFPHLLKF